MGEHGHGGGSGVPHNPSIIAVLLSGTGLFEGGHVPTWVEAIIASVITAGLTALVCWLLTRNMQRIPSRTQALVEWIVQSLDGFTSGMIGENSRRYLPLVGTLFIYILLMNLGGIFPLWTSPTANINITFAMAICVFLYVQYEGIRVNGLKGYINHFVGEPKWLAPLNFPLHVIGELVRPISLSVRLFGNIFGEDTVIAVLIALVAPLIIPFRFLPLQLPMLLLAIFTAFVQAMVFSILTCVYIAGATVHEDGHGEGDHGHGAPGHHPAPAAAH